MTRILDFSAPIGQKSGRGHWNDLDMLEIGNGGMTFDEYGKHEIFVGAMYLLYPFSHTLLDVGVGEKPAHSGE